MKWIDTTIRLPSLNQTDYDGGNFLLAESDTVMVRTIAGCEEKAQYALYTDGAWWVFEGFGRYMHPYVTHWAIIEEE